MRLKSLACVTSGAILSLGNRYGAEVINLVLNLLDLKCLNKYPSEDVQASRQIHHVQHRKLSWK